MTKTKHIIIGRFELILFCNEDWTIEKPLFGTISFGEDLIGDNLEWLLEKKIKEQIKVFSIEDGIMPPIYAEDKDDYRQIIKELRKEAGCERLCGKTDIKY